MSEFFSSFKGCDKFSSTITQKKTVMTANNSQSYANTKVQYVAR